MTLPDVRIDKIKFKLIQKLRSKGPAEFIEWYDQGQDGRLNGMDITSDGWCHGMAVHWLIRKKTKGFTDDSFWSWTRTPDGARAFRHIMADQGVRSDLALILANRALKKGFADLGTAQSHYDDDASNKNKVYLTRAGLSFVEKHANAITNPPFGQLTNHILTTPGNYARIGVFFAGGGGHAIAAVIKGKLVRFMDPNAGEFEFKTKDGFAAMFPDFWAIRYGGGDWALKSYYVEKYNG